MFLGKLQRKAPDRFDNHYFEFILRFEENQTIENKRKMPGRTWISAIKDMICLSSLSIDDSLPVFKSVVIASVAIDRLWSEIRPSISMLQEFSAAGCNIATLLSARIAAKRSVGLEDERKSCRTVIAGCNSRDVTWFKLMIALQEKDYTSRGTAREWSADAKLFLKSTWQLQI